MKKMFLILLFSLIALSSNVFAQLSSGKWQTQPIKIDGDGSDWGLLPRFFNTESNLKYEFRNDATNLYFILKAADRATQMQLFRAGFSIRFKLKTATPLKTEITFQANKFTEMPPMNSQEVRTDILVDKSVTKPEIILNDTVLLDGFQFSNGMITSKNKENIFFASSKSNKELATYEIQVPLRELFGNNYSLDKVAATQIQLQVVLNELSQNEIRKMKSRSGGGHSGGMYGGGRGMGEGRGMNGAAEMGGEMQGGMGQMPGSQMNVEMPIEMRGGSSMERKSFNKDFMLSSGK